MDMSTIFSSQGLLAFVGLALAILIAAEVVVIYRALSDDLNVLAHKGTLLIQGTVRALTGKTNTNLLEHKQSPKVKTEAAFTSHFQFKDSQTLEMIFDVPDSHIKDIEFTEDEEVTAAGDNAGARAMFTDFLTESQREQIYYFTFSYSGYADFLDQVEKKLKWKSGIKKKVLVLTNINDERKITFSHYLTYEKSVLFDVIDPEIFWGVDVCVATSHSEQLPSIKKNKVEALFQKYDEIWVFEPKQHSGLMLRTLGLLDDDIEVKAVNEAYDH